MVESARGLTNQKRVEMYEMQVIQRLSGVVVLKGIWYLKEQFAGAKAIRYRDSTEWQALAANE